MSGVLTAALISSLTACSGDRPPKPSDTNCGDWDWDDETGTYYCDDDHSSYGGHHYYHGGSYYSSKDSLKAVPTINPIQINSNLESGVEQKVGLEDNGPFSPRKTTVLFANQRVLA